jgi:hypothetical protein
MKYSNASISSLESYFQGSGSFANFLRSKPSVNEYYRDNVIVNKTADYQKIAKNLFPKLYDECFEANEDFDDYLEGCRSIGEHSGMATLDVLLISLFVRKHELAIIFRPINLETKTQMKAFADAIGKDDKMLFKSSNFGPIAGLIVTFAGISKLGENFNENQQLISDNQYKINKILQTNHDKIELINRASEEGLLIENFDELLNKKLIIALPRMIECEDGKEYPLFFFCENEDSLKAKCDEKSRPYFAIKVPNSQGLTQDLLFYDYEDKLYKKVDGDRRYPREKYSKPVNIIAYRYYVEVGRIQGEHDHIKIGEKFYKIVEKTIIPDYDIYTLGRKRILDFKSFDGDRHELSERIAEQEYQKLKEGLRFDKIDDMCTINYNEIKIIKKLRLLTNSQINHASEATNSITQKNTGEPILVFTSGQFGFLAEEYIEAGNEINTNFEEEGLDKMVKFLKGDPQNITQILNGLRIGGYDVTVGARWGFKINKETKEILMPHQDKIEYWMEKAKEEKRLIEAVKEYCVKLYGGSDKSNFNDFLLKCSDEFESGKIRIFIKSEYFSEEEKPGGKVLNSEEESDIIKKKLELVIAKLDIIAQEEKIEQLKLASNLIYGNYEDFDLETKKIADDAQKKFEDKVVEDIASREKKLEENISYFREKIISYKKTIDDDFFQRFPEYCIECEPPIKDKKILVESHFSKEEWVYKNNRFSFFSTILDFFNASAKPIVNSPQAIILKEAKEMRAR